MSYAPCLFNVTLSEALRPLSGQCVWMMSEATVMLVTRRKGHKRWPRKIVGPGGSGKCTDLILQKALTMEITGRVVKGWGGEMAAKAEFKAPGTPQNE